MKERFKKAIKEGGYTTKQVAEGIGLKADTLRRALSRNSINDGYLILIQKEFGISSSWLKEGKEPMLIIQEDIIKEKIENDVFAILDNIDPEKIVAYQLLKLNKFQEIPSFVSLVEKIKVSQRISDIINKKS